MLLAKTPFNPNGNSHAQAKALGIFRKPFSKAAGAGISGRAFKRALPLISIPLVLFAVSTAKADNFQPPAQKPAIVQEEKEPIGNTWLKIGLIFGALAVTFLGSSWIGKLTGTNSKTRDKNQILTSAYDAIKDKIKENPKWLNGATEQQILDAILEQTDTEFEPDKVRRVLEGEHKSIFAFARDVKEDGDDQVAEAQEVLADWGQTRYFRPDA